MILLKKWARHEVKSYTHCVNQFLRVKRFKKLNQECKQKQSLLFNFCNIFDLLISRTEEIVWWPPVFKPDSYIFSYNEQLRKIWINFIGNFLLYYTSLSAPERYYWVFSGNGMVNRLCGYRLWDVNGRNIRKLLSKQNISETLYFEGLTSCQW